MKQCTYCGKEHPDDVSFCSVDGKPLQDVVVPSAKETKEKLSMLFIIVPGIIVMLVVYALIRPHGHYTSAAAGCIIQLRWIDTAKQEWALEHHKTTNDVPTWSDLYPYLPNDITNRWFTNGMLVCPSGGVYTIGRVGEPPVCSLATKWPYQHTLP